MGKKTNLYSRINQLANPNKKQNWSMGRYIEEDQGSRRGTEIDRQGREKI
jgi:hypothetical protein